MEQEIKPASGRLGVLVVGVGGAVATTMITEHWLLARDWQNQ